MRISLASRLITGVFLSSAVFCDSATRPTVTIGSGAVVGTTTLLPSAIAAVNKYLGIPFAASPPERFSPPSQPAPWSAPLDASASKPVCIQQFNFPESSRNFTMAVFNNPGGPPLVESEDCLYLNVFSPSTPAPKEGRAVMFWIYGGNLQFGGSSVAQYDGSSFAALEDVVVVTANYRTNVFGFSNSPEIPLGSQNSGFLDQRFALQWVQSNIGAFGGNSSKVTIFGESAGGYSVKQLFANPPTPLPFHAVILESEATSLNPNATIAWTTLVESLNCTQATSQLACVRAAPASIIKSIVEHAALLFSPVQDSVTSSSDVRREILSGKAARVPFLIGTNSQEGRVLVAPELTGPSPSVAGFVNVTFAGTPAALQSAVIAAYPLSVYGSDYHAISQIVTDIQFLCPASQLADFAVTNRYYRAWQYYFNASFPNTQVFPDAGVYHSSEIPEVFGTYPTANVTLQEGALSRYMQGAWARFAKFPLGGPGWPMLGMNQGADLGALGSNGNFGVATVNRTAVTEICKLYAPLLNVTGL